MVAPEYRRDYATQPLSAFNFPLWKSVHAARRVRILTDAPAPATSPLPFVDRGADRDYPKWTAPRAVFYFPEQKIDAANAKVFCVIATSS